MVNTSIYICTIHIFIDPITVLGEGLKSHFMEVTVKVTECPDLSLKPFDLAAKGKIDLFAS